MGPWRGLSTLWAGTEECCSFASGEGIMRLLPAACCLLPAACCLIMTSADLNHNDKLLAAGKKEKLEWVTPKISLMLSQDTLGSQKYPKAREFDFNTEGPS